MAAIRVLVRRDILLSLTAADAGRYQSPPWKLHPISGKVAPRRGPLAAGRGAGHPGHGHHRRADAADRLGPFHHRMEADHGRDPAAERRAMGRRLRQVSAHPAICAGKSRHEPGGLQGHLLVGMDSPFSGPAAGRGVLRALRLVRRDRRDPAQRLAALAAAVRCWAGCRASSAGGW